MSDLPKVSYFKMPDPRFEIKLPGVWAESSVG